MSKASVPAVIVHQPTPALTDAQKTGYVFTSDRWEGEEAHANAWAVALYWQAKGWTSNIHEGEIDSWVGGKRTMRPYFKVWIRHPTEHNLYSWWTPTDADWADDPVMDELTWFEFVKTGAKK